MLSKGDLDNRLDPLFYSENIFNFLKTTSFEVKKIREINTFVRSGFGAGRQDQDVDGYIQIRPTNLDENGFLKFDKNICLPERYLETNAVNVLQKEDVLFNNTNSQELVGKTAYFEEEGTFFHSNHITVIRVDKDKVLPKYLWILLNIYQQRKIFFNICTNWNNQSGVGTERLLSLKIPVPNLEIQQKIIETFEQAYATKKVNEAQAKALLASIDSYLLEELGITLPEQQENSLKNRVFLRNINEVSGGRFDGYFYQEYFRKLELSLENGKYPIVKVSQKAKKITSGSTPLSGGDSYTNPEEGIPFVRSGEINEFNEIDFENCIYLKKEVHEKMLKGSKLQYNDILIAIVGATIGQIAVYKSNREANINQALALVRFNDDVLPEFFKSFLFYSVGKGVLYRLKRPVARANINLDEIGTITFPFPPLEIQEKIVSEITKRRQQAQALQAQAKAVLEQAKMEVEGMILGENE